VNGGDRSRATIPLKLIATGLHLKIKRYEDESRKLKTHGALKKSRKKDYSLVKHADIKRKGWTKEKSSKNRGELETQQEKSMINREVAEMEARDVKGNHLGREETWFHCFPKQKLNLLGCLFRMSC